MNNARVFEQLLRAQKYIVKACEELDGEKADEMAVEEWLLFYARESVIEIYLSACRLLSEKCEETGLFKCFY